MEGRFLREHGGMDVFTLSLLELKDDLAKLYAERGHETEFLSGAGRDIWSTPCPALLGRSYHVTRGAHRAAGPESHRLTVICTGRPR